MTNIDIDYANTDLTEKLLAAADDVLSIGRWWTGFSASGFKWDFDNNPPPRGVAEDRLASNVLMYQRFPPEERPARLQLISTLTRYLGLESPDQVWVLVENYHPNAQRGAGDDELLSNIFGSASD